MFLFLVLPCLFLLHLICSFYLVRHVVSLSGGKREAILWMMIQNGVLCWVYAEGASAFNWIGYSSARLFWGAVLLLEFLLVMRKMGWPSKIAVKRVSGQWLSKLKEGGSGNNIIVAGLFLLVPLFVLATLVPPNNYDSNNYHLHRVMAWVHYGNLNHYPTPYLQQLYLNVFAEYGVLNVYLVTGSDQFVNLVQFLGGIGCLAGVTLVAKEMGMEKRGQVLSGFSLLTVPSFLFELTTTQVELVATGFFLSFLYFGFRLQKEFSWLLLMAMGLSLAFAVFTKYPAALFAIPFCIYFGISYLLRHGLVRSGGILAVMVVSLLVVFSVFWSRNYGLFGNAMSPVEGSQFIGEKLTADRYSVLLTISNTIKNASLHWGLPHGGFNNGVENAIVNLHHQLKIDINEPAITRDNFEVKYSVHEDTVPNNVHFLMAGIALCFLWYLRMSRRIVVFGLLALAGFILFSTVLKYQQWSTRTHLPFFAMGAVLIGYFLSRASALVRNAVLVLFLVPAFFFVAGNPAKPVFPAGYYAKKLTAHIPAFLCIAPPDLDAYRESLWEVYDFAAPAAPNCFALKAHLGYGERKQVFGHLTRLGYFEPLSKTVFNTRRDELYFMNEREKYLNFKEWALEIKGESPGVGVMGRMSDGFYFFSAALKACTGVEADFEYIYTSKSFASLTNGLKPHCYQYILTDDLELVYQYFAPGQIARVVQGEGRLALVCLKESNCGRFTF